MTCVRRLAGAVAALVFIAFTVEAQAQGAVITGRVVSEQGEELAGANVFIPEMNISIATGAGGRYTLTIPAARVSNAPVILRARAIGFVPGSREVILRAGTQSVDFTLRQDVNRLEEVVITGVTGATQQIKVPFKVERLSEEQMPVKSDPLRMITGKVPGASILSTSGRPGASPSVILRGPTSISGAGRGQEPLYIVDGAILAGSLSDINPGDIESIEVVKGAAAASLYGARAGNGVIQITTKSGRTAALDGLRFSMRSEYGTSDIERDFGIARLHPLMLDETGTRFCVNAIGSLATNDFSCRRTIDYAKEVFRINNQGGDFALPVPGFPIETSAATAQRGGVRGLRNQFQIQEWPGERFNAVDQVVDMQPYYSVNADMTGRFSGTSFFASLNRQDNSGALRFLQGQQRTSGRLNLSQRIGDRWDASFRTYYSRNRTDGSNQQDGGTAFFRLTRQPPIANVLARDSSGRLFIRPNLQASGQQNENPLNSLANTARFDRTDRYLGSGTLKYTPFAWLDLEGNLSFDGARNRYQQINDKGFRTTVGPVNANQGLIFQGASTNESWNSSIDATARKTFRDLNTRLSMRYLFDRQDTDFRQVFGTNLAVSGVTSASNATLNQEIESGTTSIRGIGFFTNLFLDWKDRYIVEGLVRRDGSSLFGRANRWKTFGRGSVAWRVSQEPFWRIPALNEVKLRASRGTAGGRPNFVAQYETFVVSTAGVQFGTLGNRFLRPELIDETELGIDLEAFNRIALSVTHAASEARDQILLVPAPAATGFANQYQNAGTMENKTWEASLNVPMFTRRDFGWSQRVIYSQNRAVITKLNTPPFTFGSNQQATGQVFLAKEGERYGTIYGRKFLRSCAELPAAFQANCGGSTSAFQVNDQGWLVWVGAGNTWSDGITKNLWSTSLNCADARCTNTPYGRALVWGHPIVLRDSTGAGQVVPIGNALPDWTWGWSTNLNWKRVIAYAQIDGSVGRDVWNQGKHWALLDNLSIVQDQAGKTVETAKPTGYYWRNPEIGGGLGGFYDQLANPNNFTVEDASYAKLRELTVGYKVGNLGAFRGDWTVSLTGRNLKTWTDYTGFDPEVGSTGGGAGAGNTAGSAQINAIDAFTFPNTRTLTFTVSTTF